MNRKADPLMVACPEPKCAAKIGERCPGLEGEHWHWKRAEAAKKKALAAEPLDDRPWCQRDLTSIAAELDRLFRRAGRE